MYIEFNNLDDNLVSRKGHNKKGSQQERTRTRKGQNKKGSQAEKCPQKDT